MDALLVRRMIVSSTEAELAWVKSMPDLYNPFKKTVGDLLSTTSPRIIVSDYQRDYSWTESEADVFFRDLLAFSDRYPDRNIDTQEYFLGSMVLVTGGADHLILDGQQRLATATILLSVIRDYLDRYDKNASIRLSQKYMYDNDDATGARWYKLTLNRYDSEFFRREIQDGLDGAQIAATLESHRLIVAFEAILRRSSRANTRNSEADAQPLMVASRNEGFVEPYVGGGGQLERRGKCVERFRNSQRPRDNALDPRFAEKPHTAQGSKRATEGRNHRGVADHNRDRRRRQN